MISPKEKKDIVKRLHYIKGQLGGIEKMLEDGRPVKEVYGQLKAVEQALHQAIYVVLDGQLKNNLPKRWHSGSLLVLETATMPNACNFSGMNFQNWT